MLFSCLIFISVQADNGPCRFDEGECSCKYGKESQGVCWDKIAESPGMCKRRFCRSGWTCSCGGRTHLCSINKKTVNVLGSAKDVDKKTAECKSKTVALVSSKKLILGSIKFYLSPKGVAANECNEIAWWLDGKLHGYHYAEEGESTKGKIDEALKERQEHKLLELKPDSLIAFRVKNGSYYCFQHYAEMVVNGVKMSTETANIAIHYSRQYNTDWYMPRYKLTADKLGKDESEPSSKFLPLRETMMSSGRKIKPKEDLWTPEGTDRLDSRRGNWYYRLELISPKINV